MPAAPELTDLESVRQFMQKALSDRLQDDDLETLILQASGAIERHLSRHFVSEVGVSKSFEFLPNENGWDRIDVTPYELRTVTSVSLDPDLTPVALTSSQYRLFPYPSRDGTFFGLRFAELPETTVPAAVQSPAPFPFQTRRVDIKGDWGLEEVPEEVRHWTNVTVEAWAKLRREGIVSPEQFAAGEGHPPVFEDIPGEARRGLSRWKRPTGDA